MTYDNQRSSRISSFFFWWKVTIYEHDRLAGQCFCRERPDAVELANSWVSASVLAKAEARTGPKTGPERVVEAIKKDRGGEAPPTVQGWA